MGTELQYAINLLATRPKTNSLATINSSNSREFFKNNLLKENTQRTAVEKIQDSMDRLLEQCNREAVRKTMLKHEETFKEQVQELHRLYRVQKMLMAELRNVDRKIQTFTPSSNQGTRFRLDCREIDNRTGYLSPGTGSDTNSSPFTVWQQTNSRHSFHLNSVKADPNSQERSGSCSGETMKMGRGFDLEQPVEENISTDASAAEDQTSFSFQRLSKDKMIHNSSTNLRSYPEGENELELTLSIGCPSSKKKLKNHQFHPGFEFGCLALTTNETRLVGPSTSIRSDKAGECSGPSNTMGTETAAFERERQRQACLFPALSLNRT